MTEEQPGGTAPDAEATASTTNQAPEQPAAAVAVADEPAPTADATTADAPSEAVADPDPVTEAPATAEAPAVADASSEPAVSERRS